ncbi:preprotein translocase subunit SecA [Pseudomonas luteola]
MSILKRILKTQNQRSLNKLNPTISRINALTSKMQEMSDKELQNASACLRNEIALAKKISTQHIETGFALVREASKRVLGMFHYDVQLIGGLVLNQGKIAEMRTGEGKTLVATLPSYLNSVLGQVHVVTVNDYLAKRDCEIIKPIFDFLGVTASYLQDSFRREERVTAYQAEIVYGTSNQFGFDYLRDNMVFQASDKLQKNHHFAIIDEADSILIDEARTPLIISGEGTQDPSRYIRITQWAKDFSFVIKGDDSKQKEDDHLELDVDVIILEKTKSARLTDKGFHRLESLMSEFKYINQPGDLYTHQFLSIVTDFQTALRARHLYKRDIDYIVRDDKIEIIDENTGRISEGRRWSEGLHQFIEAKEGVTIKPETVTLGTITLQNFYKLYDKISGMTGTADTEAAELLSVYGLDVVVIPTNKPIRRNDLPDQLYMTEKAKFMAVIKDIKDRNSKGQPVLVGTSSVENSVLISSLLDSESIHHNVLNAKNHESEALIIAQAGRSGAVTIATNMAGRGTDIILGGNYKMLIQGLSILDHDESIAAIKASCEEDYVKVIGAGGLHVIGTERHDSRRVDNQLCGRSGRQGDIGSSIFYVSLEDRIMRISGGEKIKALCMSLGANEDEPLSNKWILKSIKRSQMTIEGHNFEQRKDLVKFDHVITKQRLAIFSYRDEILKATPEEMNEISVNIISTSLTETLQRFLPENSFAERWDYLGLQYFVKDVLRLDIPLPESAADTENHDVGYFINHVTQAYFSTLHACLNFMNQQGQSVTECQRTLLLQSLDSAWRENIADMDSLQDGIHLRGYSNKDPKLEFAKESVSRFSDMISDISETFTVSLLHTAAEVCRLISDQNNNTAQ